MTTRMTAVRPLLAATCALALAAGCGQVTVGEQAADPSSDPVDGHATSTTAASAPATAPPTHDAPPPAPTPGPAATEGCDLLVEPTHRLVHTDGPDEELAADVRRLSDDVADNALATVTSRISAQKSQDEVDPATVEDLWGQFAQLCDLP